VALQNKAFCLRQLGRHAEAARCFEARLEREPSDGEAAWGLALCLDDGGERETAAAAYRRYLGLGAGHATRERRAAERLQSLERGAVTDAEPAPANQRTAPLGLGVAEYLRRAAFNVNQRQYERALGLFEQAREADPGSGEAWAGSGDCLRALGRQAEAAGAYAAALRAGSPGARLEARLGEALLESGRAQEALEPLRRATGTEPGEARVWDALGRTLAALDRPEEALAAFDKAVATDTRYAMARFHQATALDGLGRSEDALGAFRQFLAIAPPGLQGPIRTARERIQVLHVSGRG
jgi:tetratricopeptide (TPR) repeat protein